MSALIEASPKLTPPCDKALPIADYAKITIAMLSIEVRVDVQMLKH